MRLRELRRLYRIGAVLLQHGLEVLEVNHQGEWVSVTARKN